MYHNKLLPGVQTALHSSGGVLLPPTLPQSSEEPHGRFVCVCVCAATVCMCVRAGTESRKICVAAWEDLCQVIKGPSPLPSHDPASTMEEVTSSCSLGLQHIHDSLDLFHKTYSSLRASRQASAYSLIAPDYVPVIGLFLRQLCRGMISKWAEDVAMETAKSSQGVYMVVVLLLLLFTVWCLVCLCPALNACWHYTVSAYDPWIGSQVDSSKV